jgi:hypothetical protein
MKKVESVSCKPAAIKQRCEHGSQMISNNSLAMSSEDCNQATTSKEYKKLRHNWATLFLGDINTGTWPSRLGESQMRQ